MGNLSVKGKFQGVSTLEPTRGWLPPRGWIIQAAQWPLGLQIPLLKTHRTQEHLVHSILQESISRFYYIHFHSTVLEHLIAFVKIMIYLQITKTCILKETN